MKTTVMLMTFGCAASHTQAFITSPLAVRAQGEACGVRDTGLAYGFSGAPRWRSSGMRMATSSELDTSAEYVKAQLAKVQEEYEANRKAKMQEQTRQAAARGEAAVTPLDELEFVPYIAEDGKISKVDTTGVKASVYAVYDESKTLQYIGVSRGVQQSLRLHLGRCPSETYYFKIQNIARPSRSLLEVIKDSWMTQNGSVPKGNDEGEVQAMWENPLDVIPLMTEEDKQMVAEKKEKGREAGAIKAVARRFEDEKVEILEARGIKENMRFDPKLKSKGLVDMHMPAAKPDTSVPK